ncbi:MAG: T9SS type A sorting domain-containing protein [Thiohalospira sp.]
MQVKLNKKSNIKLSVFDISGSLVEVIEDKLLNQGTYKYTFNATRLTSGVYFYRLDYGDNKIIKKMTYLK